MNAEYFKDIDTDAVYACIGPMGGKAVFRLRDPEPVGAQWEFLVPNSPGWDAVHQRIYRNPRVYKISPDEFAAPLPSLPEIPQGPFPHWKDYFLPAQPIYASRYPGVAGLLESRNQKTATAFVVLDEDKYETVFGDGEFHYFRDAFLAKEDAQRYMDQNRRDWEQLHLRVLTIALEHSVFAFPDFNPQLFDRYRAEEVVKALEGRLRGGFTQRS